MEIRVTEIDCGRVLSCFSRVQLFVTPWTVAHQAPLSMEWVAVPSSRGSSWPRDQTHVPYVSCIGRQVLYYSCRLGSPRLAIKGKRNLKELRKHREQTYGHGDGAGGRRGWDVERVTWKHIHHHMWNKIVNRWELLYDSGNSNWGSVTT